jgi:hypothetical protein
MKKITILFAVAMFVFACSNQEKAQITIHTTQIEAFHNLMQYVEEKAGGTLTCKDGNATEMQTAFDKNSKDNRLNALIDSLLNSSMLYSPDVIKYVQIWFDNEEKIVQGKDAYKFAFTILPDFCAPITAGMAHTWIRRYWNNHEHRKGIENIIAELKVNQKKILKNIDSELRALLPNDVDMNFEVKIHTIVDGNRGSFVWNNDVFMDMTDEENANFSHFINVLKHELHHVYYAKWLAEKFENKERNEGEKYLYYLQRSFIFEGIAQRYTIGDERYETKQMYANKDLIVELFDEWISVMRGLKGDSPQDAWTVFHESFQDIAIERLKIYWQGDKNTMDMPSRPNFTYYVSYNLYNSIFEKGGQKKLKYVIENPQKLLSVYNELYTDSMLVPRIPNDVVELWQNNF